MGLDERRKIRQIRRRIGSLRITELDEAIRRRRGEDVSDTDFEAEERQQLQLLEVFESRLLIRKAQSFGIEVPYKAEWFTETMPDPEDPDTKHELALDRLSERGRAAVIKQIREARFAYWKGWVDLLIPILALLVAVLALFKDIIVEVLKK